LAQGYYNAHDGGVMSEKDTSEGLLIRIKGSDYYVYDSGEEIRCSVRGRFRIDRGDDEVLPVVGDVVEFAREPQLDSGVPMGTITSVRPRRSLFVRSETRGRRGFRIIGANLDHVFLIHSVKDPVLNSRLLDRMLTSAERDGIEPVIVINKIDLLEDEDTLANTMAPYTRMDYRVIRASAITGEGVAELAGMMAGRCTMLAGPSGAGKTSLLSKIEPGIEARISTVSTSTGKGRHTTTHFDLHSLSSGGWLGDSPGIREFGVWGVEKETLGEYFRDFEPYLGDCKFNTCTHSHEPKCAVKEAVEEGSIAAERYDSYLRILETLEKG
jgi:ribosome biogenesis GTPase